MVFCSMVLMALRWFLTGRFLEVDCTLCVGVSIGLGCECFEIVTSRLLGLTGVVLQLWGSAWLVLVWQSMGQVFAWLSVRGVGEYFFFMYICVFKFEQYGCHSYAGEFHAVRDATACPAIDTTALLISTHYINRIASGHLGPSMPPSTTKRLWGNRLSIHVTLFTRSHTHTHTLLMAILYYTLFLMRHTRRHTLEPGRTYLAPRRHLDYSWQEPPPRLILSYRFHAHASLPNSIRSKRRASGPRRHVPRSLAKSLCLAHTHADQPERRGEITHALPRLVTTPLAYPVKS